MVELKLVGGNMLRARVPISHGATLLRYQQSLGYSWEISTKMDLGKILYWNIETIVCEALSE